MQTPPNVASRLYSAEQVRALDRTAIDEFSIAGIVLMKRAGRAAFELLRKNWPKARSISVYCGAGNNGGDGYILAGLAQNSGYEVQLVQLGDAGKLQGDALQASIWAASQGVVAQPYTDNTEIAGEVIVDALLGTGLQGDVRGAYQGVIEQINQSRQPVLALDIPSGLCSDSGRVLGVAVIAQATVTFIGVKQGMMTADGPACCGQITYADLQVPVQVFERVSTSTRSIEFEQFAGLLAPRSRTSHKGNFGHVLIVGGNLGMGGAALMAAQAAGRVGAGLVSVATRPEHLAAVLARSPEVMAHGISSGQDLEPVLKNPNVIVVGPGLGRDAWSEQLLRVVMAGSAQLVVDADALNLISEGSAEKLQPKHREDWIITPHPGEAGRLLQLSTTEIQQDRFAAVRQLQQRYGGAVLLKGAGSLVCTDAAEEVAVCRQGNPGMASGGMGDVLSGILGGLLAQGLTLADALYTGVCLHAAAADESAKQGERGMLATDLLEHLRVLVNPK